MKAYIIKPAPRCTFHGHAKLSLVNHDHCYPCTIRKLIQTGACTLSSAARILLLYLLYHCNYILTLKIIGCASHTLSLIWHDLIVTVVAIWNNIAKMDNLHQHFLG